MLKLSFLFVLCVAILSSYTAQGQQTVVAQVAIGEQKPILTDSSSSDSGNKNIIVHVVPATTTDSGAALGLDRAPAIAPVPPGSTFKPFQATALAGSKDLEVFQAAPLLTNPAQNGLAALGGLAGVQVLTNAAPLLGSSVNNQPIQTESNVRILGAECGATSPCEQKADPAAELEQKLDAVKEAIAEQSQQIQNNNDYIQKVNSLIEEYTSKMGLVQEHASRARSQLQQLFQRRRKVESILSRLRSKEQLKANAPRSNGEVYSPIVEGFSCHKQTAC